MTDDREGTLDCIYITCTRQERFTCEDVRILMEERGVKLRNYSTLGLLMRLGRKNGWMVPTGRTFRSPRRSTHADVRPIWRSLIYGKVRLV